MRILLLCSAFNGLSQRAWIELRQGGHDVSVELATSEAPSVAAVAAVDPELIICPFLRERVPAEVWRRYRTIIIHPGPKGDRGPSSLDWAIMDGRAAGASRRCRPSRRWTPGRSGRPGRSRSAGAAAQEHPVQRAGHRRGDRADPRGRRQGGRPEFAPEPWTRPARRPGGCGPRCASPTASSRGPTPRAHPSPDPGRRRITRRAHELCGRPVSVFDAHPGPASPGRAGHDRPPPPRRRARPHRRRRGVGGPRPQPPDAAP